MAVMLLNVPLGVSSCDAPLQFVLVVDAFFVLFPPSANSSISACPGRRKPREYARRMAREARRGDDGRAVAARARASVTSAEKSIVGCDGLGEGWPGERLVQPPHL